MDAFTSLITIVLSGLVFVTVFLSLRLIARVKNQTKNALKGIEEQIKHKIIEKIIFAAAVQRKNIYKYGQIVIKSIARLFKKIPFKVKVSKTKNNKKNSKHNKGK